MLPFQPTASMLLAYLAPRDPARRADVILGFGVCDARVAEHCADLLLARRAPLILFTGGVGAGSGDLQQPEACFFRDRALARGAPAGAIWVEPDSTNTLQNVQYSRRLMEARGLHPRRALLVAKPHRQRRVWLTCRRHLPGVLLHNAPPPFTAEEEAASLGGERPYLRHLAGEVRRIEDYGARGDLHPEAPPAQVLDRVRRLLGGG